MDNGLFDKGRNRFARGELRWLKNGDTIRALLINGNLYKADLKKDEYLSQVPADARMGNRGSSRREDAPKLILLDPKSGICDAGDVTFLNVPSGKRIDAVLLFRDEGADEISPLVALISDGIGLPVTANGANMIIEWDNGTNKIFKL